MLSDEFGESNSIYIYGYSGGTKGVAAGGRGHPEKYEIIRIPLIFY
jgi:hypothetical protein